KDIETQKDTCLRGVLAFADRNHDNQLSRPELEACLAVLDLLMQAQAQITIIDFGHGLFEFFDGDHDGKLSIRELRTMTERLRTHDAVFDGILALERLPRTVHVAI